MNVQFIDIKYALYQPPSITTSNSLASIKKGCEFIYVWAIPILKGRTPNYFTSCCSWSKTKPRLLLLRQKLFCNKYVRCVYMMGWRSAMEPRRRENKRIFVVHNFESPKIVAEWLIPIRDFHSSRRFKLAPRVLPPYITKIFQPVTLL